LALQEISSFLPEIVQILTLIPIKETLMTKIKTQQSLFTIPTKELYIGENYTYFAKFFYTKVSRIRRLTLG